MKALRRFLSAILVLCLLAGLLPAANAQEAEPLATAQLLTAPILGDGKQKLGIDFSDDESGWVSDGQMIWLISPYGEQLYPKISEQDIRLGKYCFMRYDDGHCALYSSSGRRLTGYLYNAMDIYYGFIRAEIDSYHYDFFDLRGERIILPDLPANSYVFALLPNDRMIVGIGDEPSYARYNLGLFDRKGNLLTQYYNYQSITPLSDTEYYARSSAGSVILDVNGRIKQFEGKYRPQGVLPDGYYIGEYESGEEYLQCKFCIWNPDGKLTREGISFSNPEEIGRFLYIRLDDSKSELLDHDGNTVLEFENLTEIRDSEDWEADRMLAPDPGLFWTTARNGSRTIYDADANVIVSGLRCHGFLIGGDKVLVTNLDNSLTVYDLSWNPIGTFENWDGRGFANGVPIVKDENGKFAVYGMDGTPRTDAVYTGIWDCRAYGLMCLQRNGKWYLVNAAGEEQNTVGFDSTVTFGESSGGNFAHYAAYCADGSYGIVRYLAPGDNVFADVPSGSWYESAVDYCYARGLMNGVSTGRFRPTGTTTRAMVVQVLYNYAGASEVCEPFGFTDVKDSSWYSAAVNWAAAKGVVNGTTADTFSPNQNVTREQLAVILYRFAKNCGADTASGADLSAYPDAAKVDSWARDAMCWAVGQGLINGKSGKAGGILDPRGNATRAEVATILMRFLENVILPITGE